MKLIASDLDGTLLNEKGEISQVNVRAIHKAMDRGLKFVVATGRSFYSAEQILKKANIICPIICLNGAVTYNLERKLIRNVPLDNEVCRKIVDVCQKANMYTELFLEDCVFSVGKENFMEVTIEMFKSIMPESTEEEVRHVIERRFQDERVHIIDSFTEILAGEKGAVYKVLSFSLDENNIEEAYHGLKNEKGTVITSSGHLNLEFNHPNASKGLALEELAHQLGIELKEVMALGDNLNDKTMLEKVGRGVAMGNAAQEIKELCKYTTKKNTEDGVAHAIEEMLSELQ